MNAPSKDEQILQHIIRYCSQVDTTIKTYGITRETFIDNFAVQNSLSMPILQIGELVKKLSTEFRESHGDIPWRAIAGMRDRFAHNYDGMDKEVIWYTAVHEMPELKTYCETVLIRNHIPVPEKETLNRIGDGR